MRKGLGVHVVETAVRFFQNMGFEVYIQEKDGAVTLAVLSRNGSICFGGRQMPFGIEKTVYDNKEFCENHQTFVEEWEYFRNRGQAHVA